MEPFIQNKQSRKRMLARNVLLTKNKKSTLRSDIQKISWTGKITRKHAYAVSAGTVVGEIFFLTDEHILDPLDTLELIYLAENINRLFKDGFKLSLICEGSADYRASESYNLRLGKRRATSVCNFLLSKVQYPGFKVSSPTIGESKALQPKNGIRPNLRKISKDRKVTISIDENGLVPPVTLAVRGNWMQNKTIEMNEINKGGRVVADINSTESRACEQEQKYMGREVDPILPLILIKSNLILRKIQGRDEACVECKVVHRIKNKVIYAISACTDSTKIRKYKFAYNPNSPRVKRRIYEDTIVPKGYKVKEIDDKGEKPEMRANELVDEVYEKLKGPYINITERVSKILKTKK